MDACNMSYESAITNKTVDYPASKLLVHKPHTYGSDGLPTTKPQGLTI
jgi:hypothetical protein